MRIINSECFNREFNFAVNFCIGVYLFVNLEFQYILLYFGKLPFLNFGNLQFAEFPGNCRTQTFRFANEAFP